MATSPELIELKGIHRELKRFNDNFEIYVKHIMKEDEPEPLWPFLEGFNKKGEINEPNEFSKESSKYTSSNGD